jgi:hypothetical protein
LSLRLSPPEGSAAFVAGDGKSGQIKHGGKAEEGAHGSYGFEILFLHQRRWLPPPDARRGVPGRRNGAAERGRGQDSKSRKMGIYEKYLDRDY